MIDLLYIASPSYSGSTLLTFLLASHPRIATVGELKATGMGDADQYACSCGTPIRACVFWQRVGEEVAARGSSFDLQRFGTHFKFEQSGGLANRVLNARVRRGAFEAVRKVTLRTMPRAQVELQATLARNREIIEAICAIRGTNVFLDGSKDPIRLKYMIESGIWNLKVVYLLRDGRGATNSYMRRYLTRMEVAAREWRKTNEACETVIDKLPSSSWIKVRYEDLCRDQDAVLAAILALVGEKPLPLSEDFRKIDHHILGNSMRLRPKGKVEVDEKWRSRLKPEDLAAFERVAGDVNRRHGYA